MLDANITVRVKWGNLQYGVPPNNILHLHVDTGRVNATCVDLNNLASGCRRAFEFHFENINGHGAVDYDFDKNALALMVLRRSGCHTLEQFEECASRECCFCVVIVLCDMGTWGFWRVGSIVSIAGDRLGTEHVVDRARLPARVFARGVHR